MSTFTIVESDPLFVGIMFDARWRIDGGVTKVGHAFRVVIVGRGAGSVGTVATAVSAGNVAHVVIGGDGRGDGFVFLLLLQVLFGSAAVLMSQGMP